MLTIDIEKIRDASNKLDYGNARLKEGRNALNTIKVPKGFSYSENLKQMSTKLNTISNKLDMIKKWMVTSANNFRISESKNKNIVAQLSKFNLIYDYVYASKNNNKAKTVMPMAFEKFEDILDSIMTPEEKAKIKKTEIITDIWDAIYSSKGKNVLKARIDKLSNALNTEDNAKIDKQKMPKVNIKSNAKNITFSQILGDAKFILKSRGELEKKQSENIEYKKVLKSYEGRDNVTNSRLIVESRLSKNTEDIESLEHDIKDSEEIFSRNLSRYLSNLPVEAVAVVTNMISALLTKEDNIENITNNVEINEVSSVQVANNSKSTSNIKKVKISTKTKDTNKYKLIFSKKIKTKLIEEYKINKKDINIFIKLVKANENKYNKIIDKIVSKYENKEKEFEKIFGFSLYKKNSKGEKILNYTELLVDVFYVGNLYLDDAKLLTKGKNEKVTINNKAYTMKDGKIISTKLSGTSQKSANAYINEKKAQIKINIKNEKKTQTTNNIKNEKNSTKINKKN